MSVETAMSVSDNCEFSVEYPCLLLLLGVCDCLWRLRQNFNKASKRLYPLESQRYFRFTPFKHVAWRLADGGLHLRRLWDFIGLQVTGVKSFLGMDETLFLPNTLYATNGFAVSFIYNMQYIEVDKPEGYSTEQAARIMEPDSDETGIRTSWKESAGESVQISGSGRNTVGSGEQGTGNEMSAGENDDGTAVLENWR